MHRTYARAVHQHNNPGKTVSQRTNNRKTQGSHRNKDNSIPDYVVRASKRAMSS